LLLLLLSKQLAEQSLILGATSTTPSLGLARLPLITVQNLLIFLLLRVAVQVVLVSIEHLAVVVLEVIFQRLVLLLREVIQLL
jgi:hypothetical protein